MTQVVCIGAVLLGMAALMLGAQAFAQWGAPRSFITVKPFNCAPCLCLWLTFVLLFSAATLIDGLSLRHALDALIFAFINFFYIKTKITIYE